MKDHLETCDALVGIGNTCDHSHYRYDNCSPGFNLHLYDSPSIVSSAGLVYSYHGREAIRTITGIEDEEAVGQLHEQFYKRVVLPIDCIENGFSKFRKLATSPQDATTLWAAVGRLNTPAASQDPEAQFDRAVALVSSRVSPYMHYLVNRWLPSKSIVAEGYANRFAFHPSGQAMLLSVQANWKQHLRALLASEGDEKLAFCVMQTNGRWTVNSVWESTNSREWLFPEEWRGIRDSEVEKVVGVPGVQFVHKKGHIVFTTTLSAAKAVLEMTLQRGNVLASS